MNALSARSVERRNEGKSFKASFRSSLFALTMALGVFGAILRWLAPYGGQGDRIPQDIFLVVVNLLPLTLIAYGVSLLSSWWGKKAFHCAMAVLTALFLFVFLMIFVALGDSRSEIDTLFGLAFFWPGLVLVVAQWLAASLDIRHDMEGRS